MTNRQKKPSAISFQLTALNRLRRRIVLSRLGAYVRGEQSPDARRETSRLIDRDEPAYADYLRAKQTDSQLRAGLAPVGRPERAQLERGFANIAAALNGRAPLYRLRLHRPSDWRTSLATVFLAALMFIPLAVGVNHVAAIGIATQPKPHIADDAGITPTGDKSEEDPITLTPQLVTAQFVARATPTAPENE